MLRMVRLLRAKRLLVKLGTLLSPFVHDRFLATFQLSKLVLMYLFFLHVVSCLWFWLRRKLNDERDWLLELGVRNADTLHLYMLAFQWAVDFLCGGDSQVLQKQSDLALSSMLKLLGLAALSYLITSTIQICTLYNSSKCETIKQQCIAYLSKHNISRELSTNTLYYAGAMMEHVERKRELEAERALIDQMPRVLQLELKTESYAPVLCRQSFFMNIGAFDERVICNICDVAIKESPVMPYDIVFSTCTPANDIVFIVWGSLRYMCSPYSVQHFAGTPKLKGNGLATLGDAEIKVHKLSAGDHLCEAALFTRWTHTGKLISHSACMTLSLNPEICRQVVARSAQVHGAAQMYARACVNSLNESTRAWTDIDKFDYSFKHLRRWAPLDSTTEKQHIMFISHNKLEAGTEAVLMHEAVHRLLAVQRGGGYSASVFLDCENLSDLGTIKEHVARTQNLLILLSPMLLFRPWCIIEIVAGVRHGINMVPVEIQRTGLKFEYPDEVFYSKLRGGRILDEQAMQLLNAEQISLSEVETSIRRVFELIAVPFSPHKSSAVRDAEVRAVIDRCDLSVRYSLR
eukprot:TRINITY_DN17641_c1_g3_i1.p1 TRINITY_DN17641_c1_g3~~TRINITY_DN17641_c1_g3_i1.p1  ORF type:complete len:574 (-),score=81.98 TRINITY_DN17641_c1_g3_i1:163-1884(-)